MSAVSYPQGFKTDAESAGLFPVTVNVGGYTWQEAVTGATRDELLEFVLGLKRREAGRREAAPAAGKEGAK